MYNLYRFKVFPEKGVVPNYDYYNSKTSIVNTNNLNTIEQITNHLTQMTYVDSCSRMLLYSNLSCLCYHFFFLCQ